ncbi:GNAT family N-acetyltransferase [Pseudomonas aeruginosa]
MSKNSNIKLISASIDDELLLVELMKKYHLYDGIEMTDEDRLATLRPLLSSSEKGNVWIICLGSKQIGYIATCNCYSIEFRGIEVWIDEFYIDEQCRGQGFGSEILEKVKSFLKSQGAAIVHLEVDENNPKAVSLYKKSGFEFRERFVMMSHSLK